MINNLFTFEKEIQKKFPSLCLIIAKDKKESINIVLNIWKGVVKNFEGDNFSSAQFLKEVESFFLFEEPFLLHIHQFDLLESYDKQVVIKYLNNPNPKIHLLITSATPHLSKEIGALKGVILQLSEEKPWQKKKRMEEWVKEKTKQAGFSIKSDAIQYLVACAGHEKEVLTQEIEKLMTYDYEKKEITIEDIKSLVDEKGLCTLWDLGEAFFMHNYVLCYKRLESLIEENLSPFAILSHMRTQIKTLLEMSSAYENGGTSLLMEEFPYLKGGILTKKIEEIKNNPPSKLKAFLLFLFEAELTLKTHNTEPLFVFELFLLRLSSHASFSPSQSLR